MQAHRERILPIWLSLLPLNWALFFACLAWKFRRGEYICSKMPFKYVRVLSAESLHYWKKHEYEPLKRLGANAGGRRWGLLLLCYQWCWKAGEPGGNLNHILSLAAGVLGRAGAKVCSLKALQTSAEMKPPFLLGVFYSCFFPLNFIAWKRR